MLDRKSPVSATLTAWGTPHFEQSSELNVCAGEKARCAAGRRLADDNARSDGLQSVDDEGT